jgi:putative ABC transport system permease protein
MRTLARDLRHGIRLLAASPTFTAIAVAALALGIGANTAIFSVVNSVLLRPLPYRDPANLVMVWEKSPRNDRNSVSPGNYLDWKAQNRVFGEMTLIIDFSRTSLTGAGEPEVLLAGEVSANFFHNLGVQPVIGRAFLDGEDVKGRENVALLSYALWQRRFGGNRHILGKNVMLAGIPHEVIGVLPASFRWNSRTTDVWVPYPLDPGRDYRATSGRFATVLARLKPGVTLKQAQSELSTIARRLEEQYPEFNQNWGANLVPLHEQAAGGMRSILILLTAAVGFVLLIACVNVANLLLARAASRQREIAVRVALGAGRWQLMRQLLTESMLLATVGGALGLLLAWWGTDALVALAPASLPRLSEVGVDWRVFGFTALIAIATGVLFGLVPAIVASKPNLNDALKESGRGTSSDLRRHRVRSLLVVGEVALALVLLIAAGLMIRSFQKVLAVDPGFNSEKLLTMRINLPHSRNGKDPQVVGFFQDALARIQGLPGVRSAGAINFLPLTGMASGTDYLVVGRPIPKPGDRLGTEVRVADPNFFSTMGIPLLRGRTFTAHDIAQSSPVLIINEELARTVFPGEDPIGKKLVIDWGPKSPEDEIVGVVGNLKHYGLDHKTYPTVYWSHARMPYEAMTLVARTSGDPNALAAAAIREIHAIDPDQPVSDVRPMEAVVSASVSEARFNVLLLAIFASLALALAAVGIYGVMAYNVAQRTHEIGIRVALGARTGDVMSLIVGQGLLLTLAGIAIGATGAVALTRLMASLLFGVTATDPATYAGVSVLLALVALAATYIPARRALKVDPIVALRCE